MPAKHDTQSLTNLKKHPQYYQAGGDLTVIIGDISFRVASIFFTRESTVFRDCLVEGSSKAGNAGKSHQSQKGADTPTVCLEHTIVIEAHEQVTAEDFAQLCSIFFNPKFSIYEKELDEWKTVLRLADQWHFNEVKNLAFRELDRPGTFSMTLVERLCLYQKYAPPKSYIEPLYEALVVRQEPLFEAEAEALGCKLSTSVHAVREKLIRTFGAKLDTLPLPNNVKDAVQKAVRMLLSGSTASPGTRPSPRLNTQGATSNQNGNSMDAQKPSPGK